MKTRAILSLAMAALAACASPEADLAKQAPQTLVGMPKGDLLACAGVPQHSTTGSDGTEYLSYGRQQTNIHRDYDGPGLFGGGGPFSIFGDVDTWTTEYSCVATFAVRQGRVVDLRYNENRDIQLCYQMIGNCLPPVRR
ncbi:hypothetical protein [Azospirillum sp. sgz301742]